MIILDTNICIYVINRRPMSVLSKFENFQRGELGISVVTYAELRHGVEKSSSKKLNQKILTEFIDRLEVIDWDEKAADDYAVLKADLERKGKLIGPFDMLIAAHARSRDDILVSNNVREFSRVPNLKLENWL